ncbi:beta-galactosidase [Paenibacillus sp. YAF4_2]|uniref:beta-galactosidase n=1 Tax=Paenibacillus sp. YAF4_2 TaxID=3233085 RepID=UPI003F94BF18
MQNEKVYRIQTDSYKPKEIYPSSLKLGGAHPEGDHISFTNYYMELNGKPYFAVCGEFHYSRYPETEWDTELQKMKLSGITVIPTYIFWNHHEEMEGEFHWEGNLNLRKFVEVCGRNGLYVILRIGPFCHGEVRNGGLPDWLFGRAFDVRSNDEGYLNYVSRLYNEIGKQAAGLLYKDGGPVIGIQLENEFRAAAALWEMTAKQGDEYMSGGTGGAEHIIRLKELAQEAGLTAPIYSITGWGNAPVPEDEVLPLYGGYAYTPWTVNEKQQQQKPTAEYLFTDYHNDTNEARDFAPPYARTKYPFACCEMGGGMQAWYLARFQVDPESVLAMSLVKIASGCNFIGYYMFHGGTNPIGKTGYLNESTTPKITYDFQAPIGEFGQIRASNHLIRPLHYFLQTFGGLLAPMGTLLPEGASGLQPEDTETLRFSVRTDGHTGFLFVNNYQDHIEMSEHEGIRFAIELGGETLAFPRTKPLTVRPNASFFLPMNMNLSGVQLRSATAQPVTLQQSGDVNTYFFLMLEGNDGEFVLGDQGVASIEVDRGVVVHEESREYIITVSSDTSSLIRIYCQDGSEVRIYAMTAAEAALMWELDKDGDKQILFSTAVPVWSDKGIEFVTSSSFTVREYEGASKNGFTSYQVHVPEKKPELPIVRIHDHKVALRFTPDVMDDLEDLILNISYTGNVGYAFSDGQLFHDHFHNGDPWEIGLARFPQVLQAGGIVLETTPLRIGKTTFSDDNNMAAEQRFEGEKIAVFHDITAVPIYRGRMNLGRK